MQKPIHHTSRYLEIYVPYTLFEDSWKLRKTADKKTAEKILSVSLQGNKNVSSI